MKSLTIIILGFVISSRILTEFFSFLSPLGSPSYLLLGMFSIYLSTKSKISMFLALFVYDMLILLRNIGFSETLFNSTIGFSETLFNVDMLFINNNIIIYSIYMLFVIFILLSNGIISFIVGYSIGKKHRIGL